MLGCLPHPDLSLPTQPTKMAPCALPTSVVLQDKDEPAELGALRREVEDFAKQFPTIGFEKASMRYKD